MQHARRAITVLVAAALVTGGCSSGSAGSRPSSETPAPVITSAPPTPTVPRTSPTPTPSRRTSTAPRPTATPTRSAVPPKPVATSSHPAALPLPVDSAAARQVITVTADSTSATTATLQAWHRVAGGWRRHGGAITAWLGSDGLSRHASESKSATPIGSFTLTKAFGHDTNPGTRLPYTHTSPSDWWISQSGSLYNTMQDCSSGCAFTRGDPNEHLYYETPYYDYAVVIDYNTANAPGGVQQGRGSAFFLHVTVGAPTQGCVSIPKASLVGLLQWLDPTKHPRIVIGVG